MASRGPQPSAGVPPGPTPRACCGCPPEARPARTPAAGRPACCLPRNVLSERERRKRISRSCERLRALLPRFEGRREDMASVLEMAVQFLRTAGALLPGGRQVLGPTEEDWHKWQLSQTPAEAPGAGPGAPGTVRQDAPSGETTGLDQGKAPPGLAQALDGPAGPPGTSGLAPWTLGPSPSPVPRPPPAWPPCSWQPTPWQPTPPPAGGEAQSCPGLAGPLTDEAPQAGLPGPRSVPACGVGDGPSLLLRASPERWLGSPGGRDSSAPAGAPATSPQARTEPGFLADPEPGAQEPPDGPPDGPPEPWGWDVGCPGLAFRDEADSIFPDFFAC